MKLGILCTMLKRFGLKGSYNSQEIGLGRALSEMGHTVIIYKGVSDKSQVEDLWVNDRLLVRYMWMPGIGAHGFMWPGLLDRDLDGLFSFSDNQIFLKQVSSWCRRKHIPYVPYVGTTFSLYVNSPRGRLMDALFRLTTLPDYRHMDILAKTEIARDELVELGIDPGRITIAPVGLDIGVLKHDFLTVPRGELKREFGFEEDDVVLCAVARMEEDKRPLDLLKLFTEVRGRKKFRLLLVGDGALRPALDAKIAEYGVGDEVKILRRVPYDTMWKIYTLSDYFINMSRMEIFGMAIMEAVYYQTPVVARRAIGPSVTLRGMEGHFLCDSDEEIKSRILAPYPPRELLAQSAEKAVTAYSWDRCAREFLRLVEKQRR